MYIQFTAIRLTKHFFSTSERLEIGGVPFIVEERKPRRNQALVYYRSVVKRKQLTIHTYERVLRVEKKRFKSFHRAHIKSAV